MKAGLTTAGRHLFRDMTRVFPVAELPARNTTRARTRCVPVRSLALLTERPKRPALSACLTIFFDRPSTVNVTWLIRLPVTETFAVRAMQPVGPRSFALAGARIGSPGPTFAATAWRGAGATRIVSAVACAVRACVACGRAAAGEMASIPTLLGCPIRGCCSAGSHASIGWKPGDAASSSQVPVGCRHTRRKPWICRL